MHPGVRKATVGIVSHGREASSALLVSHCEEIWAHDSKTFLWYQRGWIAQFEWQGTQKA